VALLQVFGYRDGVGIQAHDRAFPNVYVPFLPIRDCGSGVHDENDGGDGYDEAEAEKVKVVEGVRAEEALVLSLLGREFVSMQIQTSRPRQSWKSRTNPPSFFHTTQCRFDLRSRFDLDHIRSDFYPESIREPSLAFHIGSIGGLHSQRRSRSLGRHNSAVRLACRLDLEDIHHDHTPSW